VGLGLTVLAAAPAVAADVTPVYKARPAVVTEGWYVWADGMYERVNLPAYSLGFRSVANVAGLPDAGIQQSFDPHLNGAGVRGGIGHIVPGTSFRLEAGASFVGASGSTSQATVAASNDAALFLLNGSGQVAFFCTGVVFACTTNGTLSTSYTAWQANGKVLYDWKYGAVTVTPFGAIFGGTSRARQTLTQSFTQIRIATGAVENAGTYVADTTLRWTDVGARVGLETSVALAPAWTVGISGWVGAAGRNTHFTGTDAGGSTPLPIFNGVSFIGTSDTRNVVLANAEAGFAYRVFPAVVLRGFAGLNYDNRVPGITGPSYTGNVNTPTTRTPASIYYRHETSYYAGGGVLWTFGGPVVAKN